MSNSTRGLLWNYLRTRFPAWLVLSLPLVITTPALVSGRYASAREFACGFGMALLLVIEFRLWDDLCDRTQDCLEDRLRVLCQAESIRPFITLLLGLMMSNLALVAWLCMWWSAAILLVLHALLALWYASRARLALGPVANYHVVLLKYPVFGSLLGAGERAAFATPLCSSLAVVYLGLCMIEVLHDQRLRARRAAWICLIMELVLLTGIVGTWASRMLIIGWNGEGIA